MLLFVFNKKTHAPIVKGENLLREDYIKEDIRMTNKYAHKKMLKIITH
jgi:hypothetical protein